MSKLEAIYNHMPILMQNIMTSVKGYQNNKNRYGEAYYNHLQFLKEFDRLSLTEKKEYQRKQLIDFIRYAFEMSPFYRNLYQGIDLSEIKDVLDLKKLPMVDKEMLRANIEQVYTISKKGALEGRTGGTTGKSLVVLNTPEDVMKRMAILDHFKAKHGFLNLKMKRATFNGKHIVPANQNKKVFWRYNRACKQMIFSSFHINEENLPYYIHALNRFQPQALDGFFTCMCDIANYVERRKIKLSFKPIAIFPTSETLTEEGRTLLERVFQCKVFDQYASSEGAPFITECERQNLHLELSSGVFEHFEPDSDEVLVTSFLTHGTPLIRYRIGDSVQFYEKDIVCGCSNNQPIVKRIQGRNLDYLYNAEGTKIHSGNISNLFKNIPNALIRAQLIQDSLNEVTALLEVDQKSYKEEYDKRLTEEFKSKFGTNTKLIIKHVDEIPREKSGKFRMIKNNISTTGEV